MNATIITQSIVLMKIWGEKEEVDDLHIPTLHEDGSPAMLVRSVLARDGAGAFIDRLGTSQH